MIWKKKESYALTVVDVGTSKVAVAVGELKPDGSLVLLGVGQAESGGAVRKGEIVDFELAQQAIQLALADAEDKTECMIEYVYLNLTGAHLEPKVIRLKTVIDTEDNRVTQEHLGRLDEELENYAIPSEHEIIHSAVQQYYLDNGMSCKPIGQSSETLEATYHIVHGLRTRLETLFRSVMELNIKVVHYTLSSYAAAELVLNPQQKKEGALVVDMGAGVTDYLVYVDGTVAHTGVLAVGGEHVTQDLAFGLKLPFRSAELLKINHGNLYANPDRPNERIVLEKEVNADERSIFAESLSRIAQARVRETLDLIREDLEARGLWEQIGGSVHITGGASQIRGLQRLAEEVFPVPVRLVHEFSLEGDQTYSRRPDLSTVLGLLRYAQQYDQLHARPSGFDRLRRSFQEVLASMRLF